MIKEFASIQWAEAWQAEAFWPRDEVHFPRALSPLGASIVPALEYDGIADAAEDLALPVRILARELAGFVYNTTVRRGATDAEQEALERRHAAVMAEQIVRLPERWQRDYEPELEENNRRLLAFDLPAVGDNALVGHLHEALDLLRRHWKLHFLIVLPVFAAGGALVRSYEALFGREDERAPYRLLQGFPNRTIEADQELWELAQRTSSFPSVAGALADGVPALQKLRLLQGGEEFVTALRGYLARYGRRITAADDLFDPTWDENSGFLLRAIGGYLSGGGDSPEERRQLQSHAREEEVAHLVGGLPEAATRTQFLTVLQRAQAIWPLRETHTHLIDQPSFAILRRIFLEFGARLAARGVFSEREDTFMLSRAEAEKALAEHTSLVGLISERRGAYQEHLAGLPPPFIGTSPTESAPPPDPELIKFFGRPPEPEIDRSVLNGIAASPGVTQGVVRVVLTLEDIDAVQPDDVLVCPSTTPPWTPLFGLVSALVTDAGGLLSHGAIVAREYGLPAVTGTRMATRRLRSGQRVEVDGNRGVIRI
ncbi:MAG: PEP-utilizing enzyme, partial [Dehalococcoidia bacterium]